MGLHKGAIDHAVMTGRLHVIFRGVYAVGHRVLGWRGRVMAAVLACGPDAVASHGDAGMIWNLRRSSSPTIDVTVPGRSRHGRRGLRVHRVRELDARDRAVVDGIPVTSLPRTLLDLAELLPRRDLERCVEEAERLGLFDLKASDDLMRRSPGRPGVRVLRAAVSVYRPPPRTRSGFERAVLDALRAAGFPEPLLNAWVESFEVDMFWPPDFIMEIDGWEYHRSRQAFERDRRRDAELRAAGYRVERVTEHWFYSDPAGVMAMVRDALATAAR
jgi:hypothetical protein